MPKKTSQAGKSAGGWGRGRAKTAMIVKVSLPGFEPAVWRRIAIGSEQTLDELHSCIFHAFERDEDHLYSFFFPAPGTARNRRNRWDWPEVTHPASWEPVSISGGPPPRDASQTRMCDLGLKRGRKFYYLFDFGDDWWHEIVAEKLEVERPEGRLPRVIESEGKAPAQYVMDEEWEIVVVDPERAGEELGRAGAAMPPAEEP